MNRFVHFALTLAMVAAGSGAFASNAASGYITGFVGLNGGLVYVVQNGSRSGAGPTCDTSGIPGRWGINANTTGGQALLSIAMTAQSLHIPVTFAGTGDCSAGGNSESIYIIVTNNVQ